MVQTRDSGTVTTPGISDEPNATAYSQALTDEEYRQKYGTGQAATEARIRAVLEHRGRTPNQARISDIYRRRAQEFNTQGYGALREWAQPASPDQPAGSNGNGTSGDTVDDSSIEGQRKKALADAIAVVQADYERTQAELGLQQADISHTYTTGKRDLDQAKKDNLLKILESFVNRGMATSSIYKTDADRAVTESAEAEQDLAYEWGTKDTVGKAGSRSRRVEMEMKQLALQRNAAIQLARAQSATGQLASPPISLSWVRGSPPAHSQASSPCTRCRVTRPLLRLRTTGSESHRHQR